VSTLGRRLSFVLLGLLLLVGAGVAVLYLNLRHPLPAGSSGPAADALAHAIERAVDTDAFARTGAVRWTWRRNRAHLWDRTRNLSRQRWGEHEVLLDVHRRNGRAFTGGQEVLGDDTQKLLDNAYKRFINDSFWLNPLPKLFDPGVTRSVVPHEGRDALLIRYATGGVTPGDSYLWILDENQRPRAWRMWVSILFIPGVEMTWDGWTRVPTGAWISTSHRLAGREVLSISDVTAASTLAELEPGADPFARLFEVTR
jgi:hypothetical protein